MKYLSRATLVILVAAACVSLVSLQLLGMDVPAAAAKFVASTAFVTLAFRGGALESTYGRLLLVGLLLSWCGDMFLVGQSRTAFLLGLGAFLLAHLAYVSAFLVHGTSAKWRVLSAVPITAIAIGVYAWLSPFLQAELVIPVQLYTVVISLMLIFAFGTRGRGGSMLILAGAILFYLSDLSVAALRLVQTDYPTYVFGLPFYYAGQVCLALSVSQSRSH